MRKATYPNADQSKRICSPKPPQREVVLIIAWPPAETQGGFQRMTPLRMALTIIGTAYSAAQLVRFIVWLDTPPGAKR